MNGLRGAGKSGSNTLATVVSCLGLSGFTASGSSPSELPGSLETVTTPVSPLPYSAPAATPVESQKAAAATVATNRRFITRMRHISYLSHVCDVLAHCYSREADVRDLAGARTRTEQRGPPRAHAAGRPRAGARALAGARAPGHGRARERARREPRDASPLGGHEGALAGRGAVDVRRGRHPRRARRGARHRPRLPGGLDRALHARGPPVRPPGALRRAGSRVRAQAARLKAQSHAAPLDRSHAH